ncbi:MAG: hypothetical protein WCG12_22570, partial [Alcaligenaceae bacterium]
MTFRPTSYLLGLLLLAGCTGKPAVQQDITLANASAQNPVQVASATSSARVAKANPDQGSAAVVLSGSGAATNIVSDSSFGSGQSAMTAAQGAVASPIAVPSPVQAPTRLAT